MWPARNPPVQTEEKRVENTRTALVLPVLQAAVLSVCVSLAACLVPVAIWAMGPAVFWLSVAVFGTTRFNACWHC
jgi:hypothetical protein